MLRLGASGFDPRRVRLMSLLVRLSLLAFPAEFRRTHGTDLLLNMSARCEAARTIERASSPCATALWVRSEWHSWCSWQRSAFCS